jgi:hypothetical protein
MAFHHHIRRGIARELAKADALAYLGEGSILARMLPRPGYVAR